MINLVSKLILMSLMALSLIACFHDEDESESVDIHGDTIATATIMVPAVFEDGNLQTSTDIDMFQITCRLSCVIVASTSGTTDTFGRILDAQGNELSSGDDNDTTSTNFLIESSSGINSLPAGDYFIEVSSAVGDTGDYNLRVLF